MYKNCSFLYSSVNGQLLSIIYVPIWPSNCTQSAVSDQYLSSLFPSSRVTNVFYEQYLTIVPEGLFNISLCLLPTFVVCCLLLGLDLRSGLLNLITIIMIIVDTVGVMTLWNIDYNAVALINLVTVRACL